MFTVVALMDAGKYSNVSPYYQELFREDEKETKMRDFINHYKSKEKTNRIIVINNISGECLQILRNQWCKDGNESETKSNTRIQRALKNQNIEAQR